MTTLNEGDTLYLDCDTSNSRPRPSVEWFSPERVVVTNERTLEIMNIQRSAAGIYTCVATHPLSKATMNSTVNVTVQCECHDSMYEACTYVQSFIEGIRKQLFIHIILLCIKILCSVYKATYVSCVHFVVLSHKICYLPLALVPCETLQSTTNIIIVNLTSTAMGSNATYQCRDGSSDVYTTQCTSYGVWEPDPNSSLDCRAPGTMKFTAKNTITTVKRIS